MRQITTGSTDISVDVYIIDSTDGTPELGVLYNTAGVDLSYRREGAAVVDITEATLAGLTTAHTDGGFLEIGHGLYRLDVPDLAFATGAKTVDIFGTFTGMIVVPVTVQLVGFDTEVALATATAVAAIPTTAMRGTDNVVLAGPTKVEMDTAHALLSTAAAVAALNDVDLASITTEITDALRTDTLTATPQAAPPTTPTFMEAFMVVYDAVVHKVDVDSGFKEFYAADGVTVLWKKPLSDDGTNYVEGESVTGP